MSDDQILVKDNVFFLGGFIKNAYKSQEAPKESAEPLSDAKEEEESVNPMAPVVASNEATEVPAVEAKTEIVKTVEPVVTQEVAQPIVAEIPAATPKAPTAADTVVPEKVASPKQAFAQIVWCRTTNLSDADRGLLAKILGATKRPLSDFKVITGHESASIEDFGQLFQYEKLLVFDYEGSMPDKYKNINEVLISDGLDRLQGDQQLKMKLWNCIKAAYIS